MPIAAVAIFAIAYVAIATDKFNRALVTSIGALAMLVIGATTPAEALFDHNTGIDWYVIFLLLGMMILVSVIHKTGVFEYLAITAIKKTKGNPKIAFTLLLILTAVVSAFLDNVTTIMLAIPMTLLATKHLKVNPIPFILGEVFVSNIGGAAIIIGDPPNIIIASRANLNFLEFAQTMTPLAIITLVAVIPLLLAINNKALSNTKEQRLEIQNLNAKQFLSIKIKPKNFVTHIDWQTLVFFAGIFIMVGALTNVGILKTIAEYLQTQIGNNAQLATTAILFSSALISGIVDNIPFVAAMAPVIQQLTDAITPVTQNLWWALTAGADFGGNLTIIGASANVVAVGIAKANNLNIGFWQFANQGIPVTLVSVAVAFLYLSFH